MIEIDRNKSVLLKIVCKKYNLNIRIFVVFIVLIVT